MLSLSWQRAIKGKGKQSDEQCHDHQHFLVLLKCFDIIPKHIRSGSTEVDCVGFGKSSHFSIFHHHFSVGDTSEQIHISKRTHPIQYRAQERKPVASHQGFFFRKGCKFNAIYQALAYF